jgi:peptidoglycan hydrolase-like protein with peptidoglycan-binding domain
MRGSGLAGIVRLRADVETAAGTLDELARSAESPLQAAVGAAPAPNLVEDVRYVQLLLNDWRARNGFTPIAEDGAVGGETRGAIRVFQQEVTGIVDERVDVQGPAIGSLERLHLQSVFDAVEAARSESPLPFVDDPVIAHDTDDEAEMPDDAREPIDPTGLLAALREDMSGYLGILHN